MKRDDCSECPSECSHDVNDVLSSFLLKVAIVQLLNIKILRGSQYIGDRKIKELLIINKGITCARSQVSFRQSQASSTESECVYHCSACWDCGTAIYK